MNEAAIDTRIFSGITTAVGVVLHPVFLLLQIVYVPFRILIVPLMLVLVAFSLCWIVCLGVITSCAAAARKSIVLRFLMFFIALPFVLMGAILMALVPLPSEKSYEDKRVKMHYLTTYPHFAFPTHLPEAPVRHYDVFISYRREGGRDYARILQQALERRGYRCFFDYDSLQDGEFNREIYAAIHTAPNFVFVLSRGALDRCVQSGDWVRTELEEGLSYGRKIIPVVPTGHPRNIAAENLPDSLKQLALLQTTPLDIEDFFDESIDKMISSRFIKQKRGRKERWES